MTHDVTTEQVTPPVMARDATIGVIAPPPPGPDEGFRHQTRDGLTLVVPEKLKIAWDEEHRPWRSLVIDEERRVVSAGFPKFFNWDEHPGDTARITQALTSGAPVWLSEKLDGSLIIRSVHQGRVIFRTRGTLDGADWRAPAMNVAKEHCPALLDPDFMPGHSLLLEFTSPDFPIVIHHEMDGLTLLGASTHEWPPRLVGREATEQIAREGMIPLVAEHAHLPTEPMALVEEIERWGAGREGLVIRTDDDAVLVKLKSAHYLARHALRFALTPRRIAEMILDHDLRDEDAFDAALRSIGYDWEISRETRAAWRATDRLRHEGEERVRRAQEIVDQHGHLSRREFAAVATQDRTLAALCFALLDGARGKIDEQLRRELMDRVSTETEAERRR